jgi:hypothetical protein
VTAPAELEATVRKATDGIRHNVGFALAEKNIPREPTWTLLVPQALDNIEAALSELVALANQAEKVSDAASWLVANRGKRGEQQAWKLLADALSAPTAQ